MFQHWDQFRKTSCRRWDSRTCLLAMMCVQVRLEFEGNDGSRKDTDKGFDAQWTVGDSVFLAQDMNLCLSYPSATWQGQKALPLLSTGWGAGGILEDPHRFHTWLWLDSLPEGQVGVGRKQWLCLLLPTRFRVCRITSEGTQELFVQPSTSGFHANLNSDVHMLLMHCCREWEEIEL